MVNFTLGNNQSSVRRNITFFVLALSIFAGSLIPDIDHVFRSSFQYRYGKGWAHNIYVPLVILCVLGVAYLGRRIQTRLLRKNEE